MICNTINRDAFLAVPASLEELDRRLSEVIRSIDDTTRQIISAISALQTPASPSAKFTGTIYAVDKSGFTVELYVKDGVLQTCSR